LKNTVSFILSVLVFSISLFVESSTTNNTVVSFLKTGNSDCIIIKTQSAAIMIDTALRDKYSVIENKLERMGIDNLDVLILTHYDKDHVGSASEIIRRYSPKNIYATYERPKVYSKAHRNYIDTIDDLDITPTIVRSYTELSLDDAVIKIYPPKERSYPYDCSNNSSLVVGLELRCVSFLFAADIEELRIDELLREGINNYDVLKIPHHGWCERNTFEFIDAVSPKYSVITNSGGYRRIPSTVSSLLNCGSYVYTTANGEVNFKCYDNYYAISQNCFQ